MSYLQKIVKEPVTHFIIIAAVIFIINDSMEIEDKERIVVTSEIYDHLIKTHEEIRLKKLSEQEKQEAVNEYIKEEMLYREAYKRGLDKSDSRMRRNMIRKITGFIASRLQDPTEETLRKYYQENQQEFIQPRMYIVHQVFFAEDIDDSTAMLADLNQGADFFKLGDEMADFGPLIKNATAQLISRQFGATFASAVVAAQDDRWFGPVSSRYGSHFVRVVEIVEERQWAYDELAATLSYQWKNTRIDELIDSELENVAEGYEVIYQYREEK